MLPRAALAVFLVSEHDPVDAGLLVLPGHVRHAAVAAAVLVLDGVHPAILRRFLETMQIDDNDDIKIVYLLMKCEISWLDMIS